jgi:hypothetical protein
MEFLQFVSYIRQQPYGDNGDVTIISTGLVRKQLQLLNAGNTRSEISGNTNNEFTRSGIGGLHIVTGRQRKMHNEEFHN